MEDHEQDPIALIYALAGKVEEVIDRVNAFDERRIVREGLIVCRLCRQEKRESEFRLLARVYRTVKGEERKYYYKSRECRGCHNYARSERRRKAKTKLAYGTNT